MRTRFFAPFLGLAIVACQDQQPLTPPSGGEPFFEISDGFSTPPRPDFYFLFPIRNLSQPPPAEGFNPNLAPVVRICRWNGSGCSSPERKLTMSSGTLVTLAGRDVRLDGVVVYPDLKAYLASWNTKGLGLTKDDIYRIRVLVGNTELGFVDAYVVETIGQLRRVDRNQYLPLLTNSILPIPFWIGVEGNSETVNLGDGQKDQVELRDEATGQQIGVLSIPPGQVLEPGSSGQITFTLQQCEKLDIDIPQFGDCLRITSDPALTDVVGADGLNPPATISICRIGLIGPQNDLITVHRQDEATGQVFALPHPAGDDCEDLVPGAARGPTWDVGQQPAGDSPYTSLFRSALPAKMDYVNAGDAERTATPGAALPTAVKVTNAAGGPVAGAQVTFTVTQGTGTVGSSTKTVTTGTDGVAQVTWTVDADAGPDGVEASGRGIASPSNNGPDPSFDPFWPGLHVPGVTKSPVLLGTGIVEFTAFSAQRNTGTVQLDQGGSVEFRDDNNTQTGVLTIPPQQTSQTVTFTLTQCTGIDVDLPTFGPCLEITATPALTQALSPPATVSICSGFVGATGIPQNPLITLHRQDDQRNVYALPHADDDCAEVVAGGPSRGPQWDVGQQPAGESPFTSKFQNALPAKMDPIDGTNGQTAAPGSAVANAPGVIVTDRSGTTPVAGATVHFEVTVGNGTVIPVAVVSNTDGIAQVTSWTLGDAGANTVRASGQGIADPEDGGPFMPDLPTDPEPNPDRMGPVLLGVGTVDFTATGRSPSGGGGDFIVIDDMNMMQNDQPGSFGGRISKNFYNGVDPIDNLKFFVNVVDYSNSGPRGSQKGVLFHRGHDSQCGADDNCSSANLSQLYAGLSAAGYTVVEVNTLSAEIGTVASNVKVIFLMTPRTNYSATEVAALKTFLAEGGRLFFAGENPFYYSGFAAQNNLLQQMGAGLQASPSLHSACDHERQTATIPAAHIASLPVTAGVSTLSIPCAARLILSAGDVLIADDIDGFPAAAFAKVNLGAPSPPIVAGVQSAPQAGPAFVQTDPDGTGRALQPSAVRRKP